jgi:hypothetical protein
MNIQSALAKFKKIGASVVDGYLEGSKMVSLNGKSVFIDQFGLWSESGRDDCSQEVSRREFSSAASAARWLTA